MFEASEFTGLAPHATLGVVRLIMVLVLALVANRVVTTLSRSAGVSPQHPMTTYESLGIDPVKPVATTTAG